MGIFFRRESGGPRDGNPSQKRVKRTYQELQTRLRNLCQAFADGQKDVRDFLRSVAHNIRTIYIYYINMK